MLTRFEDGFVVVMLSVLFPPSAMLLGLNDLRTVGDPSTFSIVLGHDADVAFAAVTDPAGLTFAPTVELVTLTETTHVAPGVIVPPASVSELVPCVAVPLPQLGLALTVAFTVVMPDPVKLSVNATPVMFTGFGFVIEMLIVLVPPDAMLLGLNTLETVGANKGKATRNTSVLRLLVQLPDPVPPSQSLVNKTYCPSAEMFGLM